MSADESNSEETSNADRQPSPSEGEVGANRRGDPDLMGLHFVGPEDPPPEPPFKVRTRSGQGGPRG